MKRVADPFTHLEKIFAATDAHQVYVVLLEEICRMADGLFGSLYIADEKKLSRVYTTVPFPMQVTQRKHGFLSMTYSLRKPRSVTMDQFHAKHPEVTRSPGNTLLLLPLFVPNKSIGVISVHSKHTYSTSKMNELTRICSLAAHKLENLSFSSKVKQALSVRDVFVAIAGHELKTPLTTIRLYTELIEKFASQQKVIPAQWVSVLDRETKRIDHLIQEFLLIHKKTSYKESKKQQSSLPMLLAGAIQIAQELYPKHTFILFPQQGEDILFPCLEEQLMHAFTSILINEAKFSEPGSSIEASIIKKEKEIAIQISNSGSHLNQEELKKLSEKFSGGKDFQSGLGVGLFTARRVIDQHKGEFSLFFQEGQRITIEIIFPRT